MEDLVGDIAVGKMIRLVTCREMVLGICTGDPGSNVEEGTGIGHQLHRGTRTIVHGHFIGVALAAGKEETGGQKQAAET